MLMIFSAPSQAFLKKKNSVDVKFGTFTYGNGAMIEIAGKVAKELFDNLDFNANDIIPQADIQPGITVENNNQVTEHISIRQTDSLQCIKENKKYSCKIFVRKDGTVGELPQLFQ